MGPMGPMSIHDFNEIMIERAARQIPGGLPIALPPEVKMQTEPPMVRANRYQRRRFQFGPTWRESR